MRRSRRDEVIAGIAAEVDQRARLGVLDALPGANESSGSLSEPSLGERRVLLVHGCPGGAQSFVTKANPMTLFMPFDHRIQGVAVRIEPPGHLGHLRIEEQGQRGDVERRERAREDRHERLQPRRTRSAKRSRNRFYMGAWTWTVDRRPGELVAESWIDLIDAEPVDRNICHALGAEVEALCPPLSDIARAGDRNEHTRGGPWLVQHSAAGVLRPVHACIGRAQADPELRLAVLAVPVHDPIPEAGSDAEVVLAKPCAFGPRAC
ncbi:hypothetical protein WME73_11530 [Sorangium sp. So ce302]|uniref:hypothetical protein n=1 Tax=Sorangium sp. So ce302 TaxID=3133297 RepID=UPI003F611EFF